MNLSEEAIAAITKGGFSSLQELGSRDIDGEDAENLQLRFDTALETYSMAKKIHDVFTTGDGPAVLEFYRKQTLDRVQFDPEATNPHETGFFRSGEANVVLHQMRAIEVAKKGPPEIPQALQEVDEEGEG